MRMRGLEPPRPERHTDLNRARLPIPPHPRTRDSSRRRESRSQPVRPFGVTVTMTRVLGAVCLIVLLSLPTVSPGAQAAAATGPRTEVVVTLSAPPLAGRTSPSAQAEVDREQARFAAALRARIPSAAIRW